MLADLLSDAGASGPRPRPRRDRPRHDREIAADVGLDRQSESGDQHPADDLRQSGDDPRGDGVPEGRAAGDRRLAAVESHFRRQSQYRPDAVQRRLDVYRRRQADAGRHRAQTIRNLREIAPTVYFNVPKGYELLLPDAARGRAAAQNVLQPAARDVLLRRQPRRRTSGTASTRSACRRPASGCRC